MIQKEQDELVELIAWRLTYTPDDFERYYKFPNNHTGYHEPEQYKLRSEEITIIKGIFWWRLKEAELSIKSKRKLSKACKNFVTTRRYVDWCACEQKRYNGEQEILQKMRDGKRS